MGHPSARDLFLTYLRSSGLKKLNNNQINVQSSKFINALRSKDITSRFVIHIEGLNAEKPFSLSRNIKLRPLTKRDIKEYGMDSRFSSMNTSSEWLRESAWLCVVKIRSKKEIATQVWSNSDKTEISLISALRLANPQAIMRYRLICKDCPDPYLGIFRMSSSQSKPRYQISSDPKTSVYSEENIRLSRKLYKEITSLPKLVSQKSGNLHYALRKFSKALEREDIEDEIVDIATGLESLLCGDSQSEISYRFKVRGAAVLDIRFGDAAARIALFSDIYSARSDVVHGNVKNKKLNYKKTVGLPTDERLMLLLPDARNAFSNILVWFLLNTEAKRMRVNTSKHESIYSFLDSELAVCKGILILPCINGQSVKR